MLQSLEVTPTASPHSKGGGDTGLRMSQEVGTVAIILELAQDAPGSGLYATLRMWLTGP